MKLLQQNPKVIGRHLHKGLVTAERVRIFTHK